MIIVVSRGDAGPTSSLDLRPSTGPLAWKFVYQISQKYAFPNSMNLFETGLAFFELGSKCIGDDECVKGNPESFLFDSQASGRGMGRTHASEKNAFRSKTRFAPTQASNGVKTLA